jgi:tRNA-Thr(GGU) m(6)t(6)A37 methyltransferase TsaA
VRWCDGQGDTLTFRPIGVVRCAYTDTSEIPKGPGAEHRAEGVLEIAPALADGLADIDGFSHLFVIWAFHRETEMALTVVPPTDVRPHGVFSTRAPVRPNPIGLTVVSLVRREGTRLSVTGVDMLDGTPVLDIKPYLSSVPAGQLRRGWMETAQAPGPQSA